MVRIVDELAPEIGIEQVLIDLRYSERAVGNFADVPILSVRRFGRPARIVGMRLAGWFALALRRIRLLSLLRIRLLLWIGLHGSGRTDVIRLARTGIGRLRRVLRIALRPRGSRRCHERGGSHQKTAARKWVNRHGSLFVTRKA